MNQSSRDLGIALPSIPMFNRLIFWRPDKITLTLTPGPPHSPTLTTLGSNLSDSSIMAGIQSFANDLSESLDDKLNISSVPQRSTALSNKLSSVLSASYADSEIRDALRSLDEKEIKNTTETRRRLRLDIQKEVIQRNGAIIQEFGHVAEVRPA